MLKPEELTTANIQKELQKISAEMLDLIQRYKLNADHPFEIIDVARKNIDLESDYIRFLELSLEGRIYGEAAAALEKAMQENI